MAILGGVDVLPASSGNSDVKIVGQVTMELQPIDAMAAFRFWLEQKVLRTGIKIDVVSIEYSNYPEYFRVRFNQAIEDATP